MASRPAQKVTGPACACVGQKFPTPLRGGGRGGAHEGSRRGGEEEEQGAERKEGRGRVRKFRREEQIEINKEQAWYLIRQGGGGPPPRNRETSRRGGDPPKDLEINPTA